MYKLHVTARAWQAGRVAHRHDLVVVGLGSGGIVAADLAATLGLDVVAVERDRIGGDCLWTGCVPSKALLASAKAAHTLRHAAEYGLAAAEPAIDSARVLARVRAVQERIAQADDNVERFEDRGVPVVFGDARLTGPHTVRVGARDLRARHILLCTGSRPALPELPGLREAGCLTSETVWELERAPASLIVIGGGPIGIELAQAFRRLGGEVTVLQRGPRILPRDEPALVEILTRRLRAEGIDLVTDARLDRVAVGPHGADVVHDRARGEPPVQVGPNGVKVVFGQVGGEPREWRASELLVATGRAANVEGLGLDAVGIEVGPQGVVTGADGRTAVKSVYAVGDLAGRHRFTHSAGYEASRAVRSIAFPGRAGGGFLVPWCTFTDPELAHAGLTEAEARARFGEAARTWRMDLSHSDRARAEGAGEGALILVTGKRGRLVGAHALAPAAGELIGEPALAIARGLKLTDLGRVVHVYPTISIAVQQLGGEAAYARARSLRRLLRPRG